MKRLILTTTLLLSTCTPPPAYANPMVLTGATSTPLGYYHFCQSSPDFCRQRPRGGPFVMNSALWSLLNQVNRVVNHAVSPADDIEHYGTEEFWAYPVDGFGDCEDYVLEKRRQFVKKSLTPSNFLITIVKLESGEGHAVLTVRTTAGDFILDNRTDEIRPWEATTYDYIKRMDAHDTSKWVGIVD